MERRLAPPMPRIRLACNLRGPDTVCLASRMPLMTRDPAADADLSRDLGALDRRLRAFLATLQPGDVDDLAQEAMARAWRSRGAFDAAKGTLAAWLFRIGFRVFLDRRDARVPPPEVAEPVDHGADPARAAEARDHAAALLAQLNPVERDVLLRFHRDGEAIAAIAAALAMPVGTVKSHLHRARNRLLAFERGDGGER